jgi:hypothetical protein
VKGVGKPQNYLGGDVVLELQEGWSKKGIFTTFSPETCIKNCLPKLTVMCGLPKCTMPKRQAIVIFPEVNYELNLVMENVKRESWRRSTSSPKIGILVLIMHTACSPNIELVVSCLQSWKANLK